MADRISLRNLPPGFADDLAKLVSAPVHRRRRSDGPLVSVVMPSFNQASFIERSILSVLNQDYPNVELIVVDGGSMDGTVDVIRSYEAHLAYWVSEPDRGQSDALNKGFARARGGILGWLNSDDLYAPHAVSRAVSALEANASASAVIGDLVNIDPHDSVLSRGYTIDFSAQHCLFEGFRLLAQSMFWRSSLHSRYSGFKLSCRLAMDYEMIVSFAELVGDSGFTRIDDILGCFRRQPDQKTGRAQGGHAAEIRRIREAHGGSRAYTLWGLPTRLRYKVRYFWWMCRRGGPAYGLARALRIR